MIYLDGATGEGGGQVVRTALGLSLVTGKPFTLKNIRAGRRKPGLMRQHLTAVLGAKEVGRGEVKGAWVGSDTIVFEPGETVPGSYSFAVGTAGSCSLVLQAILPALLVCDGPSELVLEGGTHNPMAPPFDFLKETFVPLVNRMGGAVSVELERPGFYPAGGGRIRVVIEPFTTRVPLELVELTNPLVSARAVCSQLPDHIGNRELKVVRERLEVQDRVELQQVQGNGPGNVLSIRVCSDQLTETFTGFGEKNVRAEKVALNAVKQVKKYLECGCPVGPCLADQLLIPMVLAGGGRFRTGKPTSHTLTNMDIISAFIKVNFHVSQLDETVWEVSIEPK